MEVRGQHETRWPSGGGAPSDGDQQRDQPGGERDGIGTVNPPRSLEWDSGTKRTVATRAVRTRGSGIQNNQWYERCWTTGPPTMMPTPLPIPSRVDMRPMPPATFSVGNSSRMIPKDR